MVNLARPYSKPSKAPLHMFGLDINKIQPWAFFSCTKEIVENDRYKLCVEMKFQ